MKKDDFLEALMMVSAKQKAEIRPFSQKVTREAFAVSLEGLKGVRISTHISAPTHPHPVEYTYPYPGDVASKGGSEEEGAYRIHTGSPMSHCVMASSHLQKELKKLAKAQGQGILPAAAAAGVPNTPTGVPATPGAASTPTSAAPAAVPPRTTTPRPGAPKPSPALQQPPPPRGRTPVGIGTPQSVSTPGPGPAPPAAQGQHAAPTPTGQPPPRGVKREREETGLQVSGNVPPHVQQGAGAGAGQDGVKIGKAGVPGVRPRPVKKQRLVRVGYMSSFVCRHPSGYRRRTGPRRCPTSSPRRMRRLCDYPIIRSPTATLRYEATQSRTSRSLIPTPPNFHIPYGMCFVNAASSSSQTSHDPRILLTLLTALSRPHPLDCSLNRIFPSTLASTLFIIPSSPSPSLAIPIAIPDLTYIIPSPYPQCSPPRLLLCCRRGRCPAVCSPSLGAPAGAAALRRAALAGVWIYDILVCTTLPAC